MQATSGTRLDAGWLEALRDAIVAERAFEDLARRGAEFRNIEGAARHAIAAADAVVFLKIHDAVRILNDSAIGGVHALILAHQQLHRTVFALVLVKLDQVPVIPGSLRHGLVAVVKGRFAE